MKNMNSFELMINISGLIKMANEINLFFKDQDINNPDTVIEKRSEIRDLIEEIKISSTSLYGVQATHIILFALVSYCDEVIGKFFIINNIRWPKYQKEIFNTEKGGEIFFEHLTNVLNNPIYPLIVYQVFILVLKAGFIGKLFDSDEGKSVVYYLAELNKILSKNKPNILIEEKSSDGSNLRSSSGLSWKAFLHKKFYILVICLLIIIYVVSLFFFL